MADVQPTPEDLSEDDRHILDSWRSSFDQDWSEERLTTLIDKLAPLESKLRRFILIELIKVDIERKWKRGQPVSVESYLKRFPELGGPADAPAELIQAEWEARKQADPQAALDMMAQRFPVQAGLLKKLETLTGGVTERAQTESPSAGTASSRSATARQLRPGELVKQQLGRYRVLRVIGQGGMGTVYLAHDAQLDRQVALKVPHVMADDGPDVLARFQREARAAATLQHPNICPVYDVGQIDGVHYLTMAFIEGRSLAEMLKLYRPFPQRQGADLVRQVAIAMQEAHQKGIIHRDLKPSNILVNQRNEAIVMDFGVARQLHADGPQLTLSGRLIGTPEYMAPEQTRGDPQTTGPGSDIYSLGVILYRLLCGRLPYEGQMIEVLAKLATEAPQPPSAYRSDIDPQLQAICLKAMARDPSARYASMGELAMDLDDWLKAATYRPARGEALADADFESTVVGNVAAVPQQPAPQRPPTQVGKQRVPTLPEVDTGNTAAPPARGRGIGLVLVATACLVAVAGGGGFFYWKQLQPIYPTPTNTAVVGPVATAKQVDDGPRVQLEQAEQAYNQKEYDKAIAVLDALVSADPAQPAAYYQRGLCYVAKKDLPRAIADFDKALAIPAGQNARTYRERGQAQLENRQDDAAIADFTQAIERAGDDALAHAGRARALLRKNAYDKALDDLQKAGMLDPKLPLDTEKVAACSGLGLAQLRDKKFGQAAANFKQASQLDPKNDAHLRGLGDALAAQELDGEALDEYTRAWRLNPTAAENKQRMAESFQRLAKSYFDSKDFKGALGDFERKAKQDPANPWALYQRGRVYLAWDADPDNTDKAIADLTQALKLDPALAPESRKLLDEAYQRLAEPYFSARGDEQKKKWQEAVDEFGRRINGDSGNSWAYTQRGRAFVLQGNLARAVSDFNKAIELNPQDALAYRYRGDLSAQQGELVKALPDYEKARDQNPLDVRNWSQYVHALLAVDKGNRALYRKSCADMYRQLGKSEDPSTLNQLVWLCVLVPDAVDDPTQLVELAQKAVAKSTQKNNLPYRNTLAAAQLRANQLQEAETLLIDNLRLREKPENQKVPSRLTDVIFLVLAKQRKGETDSARGYMKDATKERDRLVKGSWVRELEIELLFAEADRLLKGK